MWLKSKIKLNLKLYYAFDTNKSAKFLNDNESEYKRFLNTQKLIRKIDEIHIIDNNKKLHYKFR